MAVAWAQNFPSGAAAWQESRNFGTTYNPAPAPAVTTEVAGGTGAQRYRTQFTIPAGITGTWTATVSGDIYSNGINLPARLVYDGVNQGNVSPLPGPTTFTLPATPGAHTVELWIGQAPATGGGLTIPVVTFDYVPPACGCCPLDLDGCFGVDGDPAQPAYPLRCNSGGSLVTLWYRPDGAQVAAADVRACGSASPNIPVQLTLTPFFFGDGPDPAGENLCNFNHDPDVFDHPDSFDITRDPNPHLGFGGGGPHFCLGKSLAVLEIDLIFNAIADAMPGLRLAGEPDRLRSAWINGVKHLQVTT